MQGAKHSDAQWHREHLQRRSVPVRVDSDFRFQGCSHYPGHKHTAAPLCGAAKSNSHRNSGNEDRLHWWRPLGPVFRPADEAAGSLQRDRGGRAQSSLRHLRLGRGVLRRHDGQPARGRPRLGRDHRRRVQPLGRRRGAFQGPRRAQRRPCLHRHRPQEAAQHPAGALRAGRREAGVRELRAGRPGARPPVRRRPGDRLRRPQQPRAHALRRDLPPRHRHAQVPLRVAGHEEGVRRLQLHLRAHRARLVRGARLSLPGRPVDLHRRDARGDLEGGRHRPDEPGGRDRLLREAVRALARRQHLDEQRHSPARLGHLDPFSPRDLRALGAVEHVGRCRRHGEESARGADGRRCPHCPLLDRLGHQARAGRRHRAGANPQGLARARWKKACSATKRCAASKC